MSDTKTELQRKKEKLAEMRANKNRIPMKPANSPSSVASTPTGNTLTPSDLRREIDDILATVLPPNSSNAGSSIPQAGGSSANSSMIDNVMAGGGANSSMISPRTRHRKLQQYKAEPVSIEPREKNFYTKETQTLVPQLDSVSHERETRALDYYALHHHPGLLSTRASLSGSPRFLSTMEWDDEFGASHGMLNFEETGNEIDSSVTLAELQKIGVVGNQDHPALLEEPTKARELSEEEKADLMLSEKFQKFFDRTTRIIERAVYELPHVNDLFADYTGASQEELEKAAVNKARLLLKTGRTFHWQHAPTSAVGIGGAASMKQRTVTDLDWSPIFPELLLTSYVSTSTMGIGGSLGAAASGGSGLASLSGLAGDSLKDADGIVMVWNTKFRKESPEFVFNSQSAVMSACFAPFHPNLIIGGTYSGQIVLWDNRANKPSPVQRSAVSNQGHTHPIYTVCVQGTQHAHNLLSVCTDGLLCSWSLDNLSQPQDRLELSFRQTKAVAASCMAFFSNDVNNFIIGAQEATVYTGCRHGNKAGLLECFEGHCGPITGVSSHPLPQATQGGLGSLFLSSSMDWTVKLWSNSMTSTKSGAQPTAAAATTVSNTASSSVMSCIHTFEHYSDYVYDVAWSPLHPAMFASVDGQGCLNLWNINDDCEVPVAKLQNENARAFNKLRWHSSGLHIACGDVDGKVMIFDLNEQLATPHSDEVGRLAATIAEMQQTNFEQRAEN